MATQSANRRKNGHHQRARKEEKAILKPYPRDNLVLHPNLPPTEPLKCRMDGGAAQRSEVVSGGKKRNYVRAWRGGGIVRGFLVFVNIANFILRAFLVKNFPGQAVIPSIGARLIAGPIRRSVDAQLGTSDITGTHKNCTL